MVFIEYALKHISRRFLKALSLMALPAALMLFIAFLNGLTTMLETKVARLMDTMTVTAVVSDVTGSNLSQLRMNATSRRPLESDDGLRNYIDELSYAREVFYSTDEGGERYLLVGVSALKGSYANFLISAELTVDFAAGWDKSVLQGSSPVCLVSESVLERGHALGDVLTLYVADQEWAPLFATIEATIIGSFEHNIDGIILCPWRTLEDLLIANDKDDTVQAVSFTIKDNLEIDALRDKAATYFKPMNYLAGYEPDHYALTVHDETLKESVLSVESGILTVKIIIPIVLGLTALIGFLTGLLHMHSRRRELRLLRLQGTRMGQMLLMLFLESLILTLAGLLTGLVIAALLMPILSLTGVENVVTMPPYWQGLLLLFGFILGHTLAAILMTRGSLLKFSKEVA